MQSLDYSAKSERTEEGIAEAAAQLADPTKFGKRNAKGIYEVQDVSVPEDDQDEDGYDLLNDKDIAEKPDSGSSKSGGLFSFFKSMTGGREITADNLNPVLAEMKEHLIKKNVASDIAEHLCQSIRSSLLGKKIGNFESKCKFWKMLQNTVVSSSVTFLGISTLVRDAMEASLRRILTPKTSLDILRDIEQAKKEKRPYVVSFIGVNGVGKVCCFWESAVTEPVFTNCTLPVHESKQSLLLAFAKQLQSPNCSM